MKTKTKIKSGAIASNHNVRRLRVKTAVKAGGIATNHNLSRR